MYTHAGMTTAFELITVGDTIYAAMTLWTEYFIGTPNNKQTGVNTLRVYQMFNTQSCSMRNRRAFGRAILQVQTTRVNRARICNDDAKTRIYLEHWSLSVHRIQQSNYVRFALTRDFKKCSVRRDVHKPRFSP